MWPAYPFPSGRIPSKSTHTRLIAQGVCKSCSSDAATCRQLGRAEFLQRSCLGLASGSGWVIEWSSLGCTVLPYGTPPGLIGAQAILFVWAEAFHVPLTEYLELLASVSQVKCTLGGAYVIHRAGG